MDRSESRRSVEVCGISFDPVTERAACRIVREEWAAGRGGVIIPVNADVARAATRDPALSALVARGSLVVADGMPLVWAARLMGCRLPERVSGASLVSSLSEAAAMEKKSVYVFGGAEGVPKRAADVLIGRYPSLRIAGSQSPPFGFDATEEGTAAALSKVITAQPDLVFVGLGFPRQELIIEQLREELPRSWFLACGAGIPMMAGAVSRAPKILQEHGLEWVYRLIREPRRLARRYLVDDLPFSLGLIARSAAHRFSRAKVDREN